MQVISFITAFIAVIHDLGLTTEISLLRRQLRRWGMGKPKVTIFTACCSCFMCTNRKRNKNNRYMVSAEIKKTKHLIQAPTRTKLRLPYLNKGSALHNPISEITRILCVVIYVCDYRQSVKSLVNRKCFGFYLFVFFTSRQKTRK